MKHFLALIFLAIGLMIASPPGTQLQAATQDQVCIVDDVGLEQPAVVFANAEIRTFTYEASPQAPELVIYRWKDPQPNPVISKAENSSVRWCINQVSCVQFTNTEVQFYRHSMGIRGIDQQRIRSDT